MTTISLLQPWASLVISGHKKIETRSWTTKYRGTLLIHASKGESGLVFMNEPVFRKYIHADDLKFGVILGSVTLASVVTVTDLMMDDAAMNALTIEEKIFGDYSANRFAWILKDPLPLAEPVPARGFPGLFQFNF